MNQNERVLARLKERTWLQMPEALHWSPPVTRLGARIHDLRHKFGHTIVERRVPGKTYSEYKLIPAVSPVLPPLSRPPSPQSKTSQQTKCFSNC
jgi:helix-turn-helix protein